jgi:toxin secretion/phage lysis holin
MEQIHNSVQAFGDKANLIGAVVLTALTSMLGKNWPVFLFLLALNVIDFYYGRKKARETNTLSSAVGAKGIGKKVSYWVIIALAFGASYILVELLGPAIGVNLGFTLLIGWFTVAVYILNELTSIVENMVVLGYNVPAIFVRGLAAAKTAVDAAGNKIIPEDQEDKTQKTEDK